MMKDKYCSQCGHKLNNACCEDDENLKATHYRNGDPIPLAISKEQWIEFGDKGIGAYSIKDGEYYYNWYTVNDRRGLAPEGWRIPTDKELTQLEDQLKVISAFPSGYRNNNNGNYNNIGSYGYFWSSSEYSSNDAWYRILYYDSSNVYRNFSNKQNGFSVRCVKEEE